MGKQGFGTTFAEQFPFINARNCIEEGKWLFESKFSSAVLDIWQKTGFLGVG